MPAIDLFLTAIDRTISFLQDREAKMSGRRNDVSAAWQVVRSAVTRTRAYLADQGKPKAKPDRTEERAIADSWNAVGLVIRGLGGPGSKSICSQCFAKADYWADTEHWDLRNPDRDITLERVETALNRMLQAAERAV